MSTADERRIVRGRAAERRGRASEWLAAAFLMAKGYRILGRRVRTRPGEIDLVARAPGGIVCFIEVKARMRGCDATEALSGHQRARIVRAAQAWLAARPALAARDVRFDVILFSSGSLPCHLRDAWRDEAG